MSKFKVLILDDIYENVYALRLLLETSFSDLIIYESTNVKDALITLMENDIDLILSDIQMPDIDGFEFVKYLQEIEEIKDIPVILITGIYNTKKYEKMAYNLSSKVIDFISKPIDDEILCSKIKVFKNLLSSKKDSFENGQKKVFQEIKISNMIEELSLNYKDILVSDKDLVDLQNLDLK